MPTDKDIEILRGLREAEEAAVKRLAEIRDYAMKLHRAASKEANEDFAKRAAEYVAQK